MAPERDIGVKNKYPCTSLFFTFIAKTVWGHFFCTCPSVAYVQPGTEPPNGRKLHYQ